MDAIPTLSSIFSKTPAPGTRDGTTIDDTEGGQKIEQQADQAGQTVSQSLDQAGQKASQAADQAGQKVKETANQVEQKLDESANSSSTKASSLSASKDTPVADEKIVKDTETAADQTVAPAVEHDKIVNKHETREQEVVEKEIHKDHYHTTVQPLKDREVQDTKHEHVEAPTEHRAVNKDDGAVEAKVQQKLDGFQDSVEEGKTKETKAQDEAVVEGHVHHHHHEVVQPVIEKEIIKNTVTHVKKPVKETVQEKSEDHGVTKASAISVDDFKHRLDGEQAKEVNPDAPAV